MGKDSYKCAERVIAPDPAQWHFRRFAGTERSGDARVLFTQNEADVMKLLCWCRHLSPVDLAHFLSETELTNLMQMGLIKYHLRSSSVTITTRGVQYLSGYMALPELSRSYHEEAIQRRLRLSKVVLTVYRSGTDVFLLSPESLKEYDGMFLSSLTRGRGKNPWGNSRTAALLRLGDSIYAIHYVGPGIGHIALLDELTTFSNQISRLKLADQRFMFAGESYSTILSELEQLPSQKANKLLTYADAYHQLHLPVHLVSCDEVGALQLRLMAVPAYRRRLTLAALGDAYEPPPRGQTDLDALYQGQPFVMAADMDLQRIERALAQAGQRQICLAALSRQAEEVLYTRYRDSGKARVFTLTDTAIVEVLGEGWQFYQPGKEPYLTEKGEMLHAPSIQAHRAHGKSGGTESRQLA